MRVLLVEDDDTLRQTLVRALAANGYHVDPVGDGLAAELALGTTEYGLVVLDLGLPGLDGLEVLRRLRLRRNRTPVLVLTARSGLEERVGGLRAGADDYLVKPFELPELEARIEALRRRANGGSSHLVHGALEVDVDQHVATVDGTRIDLTRRELAILAALILRAGQVVVKRRLAQQIGSWEDEVSIGTVEVYIHRLRKRLAPFGIEIKTIHGLGYLLEAHDAG
ncbi:response regulator [Massilia oculi]|uniref:response regulator n=1 Tax=Massilia oculi TaxID=945844 RepID=UPI001AAF9A53|nr:response regulator [Massilia oculi]